MYAKNKLNEARFFWDKFREAKSHTNEYIFYFSAFSSAFRSITFSIQNQYKRLDGYEPLYDQVLAFFSSLRLSRDLVETRNISLKQGSRVPIMVTTAINEETGDKIRIEADPVPVDPDALRKTELFFAEESMYMVDSKCDDEEKIKIYMSQAFSALVRMKQSKNITTTYHLKLCESGQEITMDDLNSEISRAFEFLDMIIGEFERLISRTKWDDLKDDLRREIAPSNHL